MNHIPATSEVEFWSMSHHYTSSKSHSCWILTPHAMWEVGIKQSLSRISCYGRSLRVKTGKYGVIIFRKGSKASFLRELLCFTTLSQERKLSPNAYDWEHRSPRDMPEISMKCFSQLPPTNVKQALFHVRSVAKRYVERWWVVAKGRLFRCWIVIVLIWWCSNVWYWDAPSISVFR